MKLRISFFLIPISFILFLSSCFKEKPMPSPADQGIGQTNTIEMGPQYANQFFYSLASNSVVSHNSRFVYDLMFDCDANKFNIWLNTSKYMSLVRTDKTSLSDVSINDTVGRNFRFELGQFDADSNSFGNWWDTLSANPVSAGKVYIIHLGRDINGIPQGYMKMKVNSCTAGSYSFSYASISSSDSTTVSVVKDGTRNYAYYSMINNQHLTNIEPPKTEWDLCFTRYTVIFYEPTFVLPYEVTGVLHNPSRVTAYVDSTLVFDSLRIADLNLSRLLTRRDVIGYNWKKVENYTTEVNYNINLHYTYFIKADEDKFYKLRFFNFYRGSQTGYPAFEFYQL